MRDESGDSPRKWPGRGLGSTSGFVQLPLTIDAFVPTAKLAHYLVTEEQWETYAEFGWQAQVFLALSAAAFGLAGGCGIAVAQGSLVPTSEAVLVTVGLAGLIVSILFAVFTARSQWKKRNISRSLFTADLGDELPLSSGQGVAVSPALPIHSGEAGQFSQRREGPWVSPVACSPLYRDWPSMEGAKWVWIKERPSLEEARSGQKVWHRLALHVPILLLGSANVKISLMVDDFVRVFINDKFIARLVGFSQEHELDFTQHLVQGSNIIEMEIENAAGTDRSTPADNPTGIIYRLEMD